MQEKDYLCQKYQMTRELSNKIEYLLACIGAFAGRFRMTNRQAYIYLKAHCGLDFLNKFYDIEHTQSIDDAVDDAAAICGRHGGTVA